MSAADHLGHATTRADTSYETASNAVWRVTSQTVAAIRDGLPPATNSCVVVRERLTGLSDALRSEAFTYRDGVLETHSLSRFDPATSILTETVESATSGTSATKSKFGAVIETSDATGTASRFFDPYGRVFYTERDGRSVEWLGRDDAGDIVERAVFYAPGDNYHSSFAGYDACGNRIAETNALGVATASAYDAANRLVETGGATYPVRYQYDTAGRRTGLATTRDGLSWDWTHWAYDPATGLCTSKAYPDGSTIAYTYTPDNLPLRTTFPSGRWKENTYDPARRLAGVVSRDGSLNRTQDSDVFGNVTNVVDTAGNVWRYAYSVGSVLLSETRVTPAAATNTITRSADPFGRATGFSLSIGGIPKGDSAYTYDADGRIETVSATNAAGRPLSIHYSFADGRVVGYTVTMPSSNTLGRVVGRDTYRPDLATNCATFVGQACVDAHRYAYDALSRPVWRVSEGAGSSPVDSAFAYNDRSEVVSAAIGTNHFAHGYDGIGNHTLHAANAATNAFAANCLNQYTGITPASAPVRELHYDLDGNLVDDGSWHYAYDAGNRLVSVTSAEWTNGAIRVSNAYDYLNRRIGKTVQRLSVTVAGPPAPPVTYAWETLETREYTYDGWNLVHETVRRPGVPDEEIQYVWGLDLSGTLQGAGGVGGLVAVSRGGQYYFPAYDNNGNVTRYLDETGATVAAYGYDDFGNTISSSGPMADIFRHRFSTKYHDSETGLYYYGYRFYSPALMRWINRDPIGELDGGNLYSFVLNRTLSYIDRLGLYRWVVIYYSRVDQPEFKRAAETYKRKIEQDKAFDQKCDSVIIKGALTVEEFRTIWSEIDSETRKEGEQFKIKSLHIFTHSGPGRLFLRGRSFDASSLEALVRLNWTTDGSVVCHGCNTGVQDEDGNSVAKSLALGQGVPTLGQTGFAQFSEKPDRRTWFTRVDEDSKDVYLWSYGDGGPTWTFGEARTPQTEQPPEED